MSGAGAISTGTGFTVDVALDSSLDGVISGAGGLNKNGVGGLTLGGGRYVRRRHERQRRRTGARRPGPDNQRQHRHCR